MTALSVRHPSVLHGLLANAEQGADGPSVVVLDEDEEATTLRHDELAAAVLRMSALLVGEGVRPGDRVLVCMLTSQSFATVFLGAMALGAVPATVAPPAGFSAVDQFRRRLEGLVAYLEPAAIVTIGLIADALRDAGFSGCEVLDADKLHGEAVTATPVPSTPGLPAPDDLAFIQCTSGSTGDPKGVMITHGNLGANCEQLTRVTGIRPGEVTAHWLPLHHDMGLIGGMFFQIFTATDVVILPPTLFLRRPAAWLRAVSRYRAGLTAAPNFGLGYASGRVRDEELDGVDLSSWRFMCCGAEPIHPPTVRRFLERFAPWGLRPDMVAPCFGLAEATLAVTVARPRVALACDTVHRDVLALDGKAVDVEADDPHAIEIVDCGPPLDGTEVRVIDGAGTPLGPSLLGRVQVRGPSRTPGYFRDPAASAAVIDGDGWLDTGDLGYLRDGRLRIAGREKEAIVIRGANYFPSDFEQAAETVDGVRPGAVAAIGRFDSASGTERLHIVVETTSEEHEHDHLRRRIRAAVSSRTGIGPSSIELVPRRSIPKTSSGKIRRAETARLFVDPKLEGSEA